MTEQKQQVKKPRSVICRAEAKKRIFDTIQRLRPGLAHKWTRVAGDVYSYLDACVNTDIENLIKSHPSVGKTITTNR